jgi:hypothetical protein
MSVSKRLYNVFKSLTADQIDTFTEYFNQGNQYFDDLLSDWEKEHYSDFKTSSKDNHQEQAYSKSYSKSESKSAYSKQVIDDLSLFELTPPASLQAVKKARNREIKKYHPDHFNNDKSRQETAKQIMQIYNNAFERLEKYYSKKQ